MHLGPCRPHLQLRVCPLVFHGIAPRVVGFGIAAGQPHGLRGREEILVEGAKLVEPPLEKLGAVELLRMGMDDRVSIASHVRNPRRAGRVDAHEKVVRLRDVAEVGQVRLPRAGLGGGTAVEVGAGKGVIRRVQAATRPRAAGTVIVDGQVCRSDHTGPWVVNGHRHASPPIPGEFDGVGVGDLRMHEQSLTVQQHVHLPHGAIETIVFPHAHDRS